jgi:hypothetical protein
VVARLRRDAAERAAHIDQRIRRAQREGRHGGHAGVEQAAHARAGRHEAAREVRRPQQDAGELGGGRHAQQRAGGAVVARARAHALPYEERGQHEGLEHDVRAHHVRGLHLDRADGEEQRSRQARPPVGEARAQQVDETHARHTEAGHHRARGQIAGRTEPRRVEPRQHGREQVEEQAGVLVEAMIEIALGQHPPHVLDEVALVHVRLVPQALVERAEAQQAGERQHHREEDGGPRATGNGAGKPVQGMVHG